MKQQNVIGIACFFLIFMSCQNALAQLFVENGKIKRTVTPGETIVGDVTVNNTSEDAIGVLVYLEDFQYIPPFKGKKKFFPAGTTDDSAAGWISFQPKEMTIPPLSKKKVRYSITVPEDASGGYYSVMFFERQDQQMLTQGQVGLKIIARAGSLFFLETEDSIKKISVNNIVRSGNAIEGALTNDGNINLVATCIYYVMDENGVPVDRGKSQGYYLARGASASFSLPLSQDLAPGSYMTVLTFDLEDGVSSVEEFEFSVK